MKLFCSLDLETVDESFPAILYSSRGESALNDKISLYLARQLSQKFDCEFEVYSEFSRKNSVLIDHERKDEIESFARSILKDAYNAAFAELTIVGLPDSFQWVGDIDDVEEFLRDLTLEEGLYVCACAEGNTDLSTYTRKICHDPTLNELDCLSEDILDIQKKLNYYVITKNYKYYFTDADYLTFEDSLIKINGERNLMEAPRKLRLQIKPHLGKFFLGITELDS